VQVETSTCNHSEEEFQRFLKFEFALDSLKLVTVFELGKINKHDEINDMFLTATIFSVQNRSN